MQTPPPAVGYTTSKGDVHTKYIDVMNMDSTKAVLVEFYPLESNEVSNIVNQSNLRLNLHLNLLDLLIVGLWVV